MRQIDFAKELNEEQLKVVTASAGPHLVLAGAGSGKTRTLVYRVAWLIKQSVKPDKILLLTFTNKAANEMMSRVKSLLGLSLNDSLAVWGGTFHSIANRLLRYYGEAISLKNNFIIADEEDSKSLLKKVIQEIFGSLDSKRHPSTNIVKEVISYAANARIKLADSLEKKFPEWLPLVGYFEQIGQEYKKRKQANNILDFDDLLIYWLQLVKHPVVGEKLKNKWQHILVDEYQDTNSLQAEIIYHLVNKEQNLLVVGDDAQSIYSFRAADIQNILDFPKKFKQASIHKLETNYRSSPEILALANLIIAANAEQFPKSLKAVNSSLVKPELLALQTNLHEAKWIVDRIIALMNEGVPAEEIAVLFRAAHHSQMLEMELNKRGINYQMRGGLRFFERAHIKDVIAWLKILVNHQEEISWSRILNLYQGIGPATATKIILSLRNLKRLSDLPKLSIELSAKARSSWQKILNTIANLASQSEGNPAEIIRLASREYDEYLLEQYPDYRQRQDDLEQLAAFAANYSKLEDFLAEVSLQENFNLQNKDNSAAIVLSTIHQAKGLEWQAVFLMNLTSQSLPHPLSVSENNIAEERRLFYVAVTRAKRQLYLTYPLSSFNYRGYQSLQPSEFITELNIGLLSLNPLAQGTVDSFSADQQYEQDDSAGDFWDEDNDTKAKSFLPDIDEW